MAESLPEFTKAEFKQLKQALKLEPIASTGRRAFVTLTEIKGVKSASPQMKISPESVASKLLNLSSVSGAGASAKLKKMQDVVKSGRSKFEWIPLYSSRLIDAEESVQPGNLVLGTEITAQQMLRFEDFVISIFDAFPGRLKVRYSVVAGPADDLKDQAYFVQKIEITATFSLIQTATNGSDVDEDDEEALFQMPLKWVISAFSVKSEEADFEAQDEIQDSLKDKILVSNSAKKASAVEKDLNGDVDLGKLLFGNANGVVGGDLFKLRDVKLTSASDGQNQEIELSGSLELNTYLQAFIRALDADGEVTDVVTVIGKCSGNIETLKISPNFFSLSGTLQEFDMKFGSIITIKDIDLVLSTSRIKDLSLGSYSWEMDLSFYATLILDLKDDIYLDAFFSIDEDGKIFGGAESKPGRTIDNAFGVPSLNLRYFAVDFHSTQKLLDLGIVAQAEFGGLNFVLTGSISSEGIFALTAEAPSLSLNDIAGIGKSMGIPVATTGLPNITLQDTLIEIVVSTDGSFTVKLASTVTVKEDVFSGSVRGIFELNNDGISFVALFKDTKSPSNWNLPKDDTLKLSNFGLGFAWGKQNFAIYGVLDMTILDAITVTARLGFVKSKANSALVVCASVSADQKANLTQRLKGIPFLGEMLGDSCIVAFSSGPVEIPAALVESDTFTGVQVEQGVGFFLANEMPEDWKPLFPESRDLILSIKLGKTEVSVAAHLPKMSLGPKVDPSFQIQAVELEASLSAQAGAALSLSTVLLFQNIPISTRLMVSQTGLLGDLLAGERISGVSTDVLAEPAIWKNIADVKGLDLINIGGTLGFQFATRVVSPLGIRGRIRLNKTLGEIAFVVSTNPTDLLFSVTLQEVKQEEVVEILSSLLPNLKIQGQLPQILDINTFYFAFAGRDYEEWKQGFEFDLDALVFKNPIKFNAHAIVSDASLGLSGSMGPFEIGPLEISNPVDKGKEVKAADVDFNISFNPSQLIQIGANVQLDIFQLSASCSLKASIDKIDLDGNVDLWNVVIASLRVYATTELTDLAKSDFALNAELDAGNRKKLETAIIKKIDEEFDKLLDEAAALLDEIAEAEQEIKALGVAGLQGAMDGLNSGIRASERSISSLKDNVNAAKGNIRRVQGLIDQYSSKISTAKELVKNKLAELDAKMEKLEALANSDQEALKRLEKSIKSVKASIDKLQKSFKSKKYKEVKKKVDDGLKFFGVKFRMGNVEKPATKSLDKLEKELNALLVCVKAAQRGESVKLPSKTASPSIPNFPKEAKKFLPKWLKNAEADIKKLFKSTDNIRKTLSTLSAVKLYGEFKAVYQKERDKIINGAGSPKQLTDLIAGLRKELNKYESALKAAESGLDKAEKQLASQRNNLRSSEERLKAKINQQKAIEGRIKLLKEEMKNTKKMDLSKEQLTAKINLESVRLDASATRLKNGDLFQLTMKGKGWAINELPIGIRPKDLDKLITAIIKELAKT